MTSKEVALTHLRKLASKMNKEDKIKGVWKMSKADLKKELDKLKYEIKHNDKTKQYELRPRVQMNRRKVIKL
jgi:2-phosphoglycerate kinase